jgi:hypothetical protein
MVSVLIRVAFGVPLAGATAGARVAGVASLSLVERVIGEALRSRLVEAVAADLVRYRVVERVTERLLAAGVLDRALDGAEAAGVPQHVAERLLADGIAEQIAERLLAGPELERIVDMALESPRVEQIIGRIVESRVVDETVTRVVDERATRLPESAAMWALIDEIAQSPAVTAAITQQGAGFADQVAGEIRRRTRDVDARLERSAWRLLRRRSQASPADDAPAAPSPT